VLFLGNGSINTFPRQQICNNGGSVVNSVFYLAHAKGGVIRTTEARRGSWKRAAIQRGLEPEGRGRALVRSSCQEMSSNRLRTLVCVL
jgi:hypothetical protein